MNIILAGMPGCGKSTVAAKLASVCGYTVVDTDELIVREYGEISKIFEEYGEPYFRSLEHEVIKKIGNTGNKIIATGGGCILNDENVKLLKAGGKIIYLKTSIEVLAERLKGDTARPLLKGDIEGKLKRLCEARTAIYENIADITVATDGRSIDEIVKEILEKMK